jgi:hypothetical protein
LERLINIGIYDRGECLDLNNNPSEERNFQYVVVLMSMLWDRVHDLESEVAFALVLRCCSTEQLHRMFVTQNRSRGCPTPLNVS